MQHPTPASLPLIDEVRVHLRARQFGRQIRGYTSVGSTNTVAAEWANEGAAEGSVVLTEYQATGRGRHGRTWEAEPGQNLTFSLILRPPLPSEQYGLITLAAGVGVVEAIERFVTPLTPFIKWPNDVLLEGRKCCGMLLESVYSGPNRSAAPVILGIGLNVNQDAFPPGLASSATSLLLEVGRPVPRAPLLAEVLLRLERRYQELDDGGGSRIVAAYERHLRGLGEATSLRLTGQDAEIEGVMLGVTATGGLRLRTDTGIRVFHAGEVSSRRLHTS